MSQPACLRLPVLLLAALLGLAGCLRDRALAPPAAVVPLAQSPVARKADPADPTANAAMPVDPAIRLGTLENGLRYFVRSHGQPRRRASLRLVVDAGSVLEADDQRGFAHFVEHMAFNGTRLFRRQAIVEYLESVGMRLGSDANASTSFDETIYTFTVPTDDPAVLSRGLLILQQIAHEVSFDPEEVTRERGVIIEEWRLGLGAQMRVLEQIMPVLFAGSRYADRLPIGTRAALERATAADLRRFYDRWYRPDLMAVIAVGDFDDAAVEKEIRQTFAAIPKPAGPAERPAIPIPAAPGTRIAVGQDPELGETSVGVLQQMPRRPDRSEGDYRRHIVEGLYHDMLSARLEELTRTPSPPFLYAVSTTQDFVRPTEMFAQLAGVAPSGIARALEAIAREVERVARHGFSSGELERAKAERLRQMRALVKERVNLPSDAFADEMGRHFLTGEAMPGIEAELRLHERYLPGIGAREMSVIAHDWLQEQGRLVVVQGPKDAQVPSPEALLGVLRQVEKTEIPPYVDRTPDGPLVPSPPPPGRIERTTKVAELGLTEWTLSNGVRVVVKPTDFKQDQVLMAAFSPGGTSLVPDRAFRSAQFAADIVGASGLGAFDPTQLRNALAGKLVDTSPYIDELHEGLLARGSPEDLTTLHELVYLSFTAPRRDPAVFAAFRAQLAEQLAGRRVDPEAVFADKLQTVLYRNHPRRRPLAPGDEKAISLDQALAVYRERFANAADFTFVVVGAVTPDALAPLAAQHLATLPGKPGRRERWRDRGVRPVGGVQRFEVRQGSAPRSLVQLVFTGPLEAWSRKEEIVLRATAEALGTRLREVLREELGATYTVGVSGELERWPRGMYQSRIVFSCDPPKVDELVAAVFKELEAASGGSLGETYLPRVKEAQRRALEQAQTSNEFWLRQIVTHYRYDLDPRLILSERALIDELSPADLTRAARSYFDRRRHVLGVLRPQGGPTSDARP